MILSQQGRFCFFAADLVGGYTPVIGDRVRFEPASTLKLHHLARNVRRDVFAKSD